jgi:uncharacterized repeat protein (TIGR03803 family)
MSRTFVLQSIVFSVSLSLLAACAGGGGSTSGPLPQTDALAVGAAQRSVSSIAVQPSATKYKSLYSFKSAVTTTDGTGPWADLIDVNGTLYGTTSAGGRFNRGAVFAVSTSGKERVIYSFSYGTGTADGFFPAAGLIDVNGTLYGTTRGGGANNGGTVFAVTTSGNETVLHSFEGCCGTGTDGSDPHMANLTYVNGVLYGTTTSGGASGYGTVFALTTSGTESILHSFASGTDGAHPFAGLTFGNGILYGTTVQGGAPNGGGTVFAVTTSGNESVLHSFGSATDGAGPSANLIYVNGVLYGTTTSGGASGYGTVFALNTSGTESILHILHSFAGGADGSGPEADLIDVNGTLYGTTGGGGTNNGGTVFAVTTSGSERVLHSFEACCGTGTDGSNPLAGLINVRGAIYGTTHDGGASGFGTVFQVSL